MPRPPKQLVEFLVKAFAKKAAAHSAKPKPSPQEKLTQEQEDLLLYRVQLNRICAWLHNKRNDIEGFKKFLLVSLLIDLWLMQQKFDLSHLFSSETIQQTQSITAYILIALAAPIIYYTSRSTKAGSKKLSAKFKAKPIVIIILLIMLLIGGYDLISNQFDLLNTVFNAGILLAAAIPILQSLRNFKQRQELPELNYILTRLGSIGLLLLIRILSLTHSLCEASLSSPYASSIAIICCSALLMLSISQKNVTHYHELK